MPRSLLSACLWMVCFLPGIRAAAGPLSIDFTQSSVEVAVKATVDSFVAHLTQYEPAVTLTDDGRVLSARLAFHFRDIVTGKAARDKAMHEWQNTESFPDGEFALSSLQPSSGSDFTALGRLTLHGVTRDIHFPVSISRDGALLEITGDATVDTREFGLPVIRMLGILKVNPLVHVRIHLKGTPTESGGTRQ